MERTRAFLVPIVAVLAVAVLGGTAHAIPAFARKYHTSCLTCHVIYPKLNPFGEAFRRLGYRYPSVQGSLDSDEIQAATIPLGQEQYKKLFPKAVWPDQIMEGVPLAIGFDGAVNANLPGSDAKAGANNTFTWDGLMGEMHLWAGGALDDHLTYFAELTIAGDVGIEHAVLDWDDFVKLGDGNHINLWAGRLVGPSLTSWGMHSSYAADTLTPETSLVSLYSTNLAWNGMDHPDGIELNGIVQHRLDWALGWLASNNGGNAGPYTPDARDFYAHVGYKLGGMTLDGEGNFTAPDPQRPWAETSLTLDAYYYHSQQVFDNGTGAGLTTPAPEAQINMSNRFGAAVRGYAGSLELNAGLYAEYESQPYPGLSGGSGMTPGAVNTTSVHGTVEYGELSYVVFPWLVPALRAEYTQIGLQGGVNNANLLRIVPAIDMLLRPDVKLTITAEIDRSNGAPPIGSWGGLNTSSLTGAAIVNPDSMGKVRGFQAEQVGAYVAWAY